MDSKFPTAKELKQLADACRKAGIVTFKFAGLEFSLSDYPPPALSRRRKAAKGASAVAPGQTMAPAEDGSPFVSDTLSEEDLLLWSVGGTPIDDPAGVQ